MGHSIILTNHARTRLKERWFTEGMVFETINRPHSIATGKNRNKEYTRSFGEKTVTVIANKNEKGNYIVISAWIDPPFEGTKDHKRNIEYKKYQKAGFCGKIWYSIKRLFSI